MQVLTNKKVREEPFRHITLAETPGGKPVFHFELINRPHIQSNWWDVISMEVEGAFWEEELAEAKKLALIAAANPSIKELVD